MRPVLARTWCLVACCLGYLSAAAQAHAAPLSRPLASVPGIEEGGFVAVIAVDIDADGDLDVVASDRTLQLHVWVNDGAGHFTRREPTRSTTWHATPTAPGLDDHRVSFQVFTPVHPQSLDIDHRRATLVVPAKASLHCTIVRLIATSIESTRSPRAPPLV